MRSLKVDHANRGKALEKLIEYANQQYASKGIAKIQKVSTPWQVIRNGKHIVSAFPEEKSTVDFIGVAYSKPIAFDAKSTLEETRFPLVNIEQHQMDFLGEWEQQGGIAFFLIEFMTHRQIFVLPYSEMKKYWENAQQGGRKSIPYNDMADFSIVNQGRGIVLDYLAAVI